MDFADHMASGIECLVAAKIQDSPAQADFVYKPCIDIGLESTDYHNCIRPHRYQLWQRGSTFERKISSAEIIRRFGWNEQRHSRMSIRSY
jgi:hypothetical protein